MIEETRLGINKYNDINMGAESSLMVKKKLKESNAGGNTARMHKKDKVDTLKSKLKCWTCGGSHLRRDCPERKRDGNSQDKQKEKTHLPW